MENSQEQNGKDKKIKENLPQNKNVSNEPLQDEPKADNEEFIDDGIRFDDEKRKNTTPGSKDEHHTIQ